MRMTISSLLTKGEERLKEAGIENGKWDAWCLLEYVTGVRRAEYLCNRDRICEEEQVIQYQDVIEKRKNHMPLQYLTGEQEFMGLPFLVNSHVLIPRQDTEVLVEEVLKELKPNEKVLDMCTGSGCILLSLVHFCEVERAVGADLSKEALLVAKRNEERLYKIGMIGKRERKERIKDSIENKGNNQIKDGGNGQIDSQIKGKGNSQIELQVRKEDLTEERVDIKRIEWVCTDMFERIQEKFDCIVSNPPYIATAVIETLMEEVKSYEPFCALDGRKDGLSFYRILAKEAGAYLNPGGMLYLEIGFDQGKAVSDLLKENGFSDIQVKKDLAGIDRVCFGRWKRG